VNIHKTVSEMGWQRRYGWGSPYPGHGPFSYLPPWERPRWVLWGGPYLGYRYGYGVSVPMPSSTAEKTWLEYRKSIIENTIEALKNELSYIEKRLKELSSS